MHQLIIFVLFVSSLNSLPVGPEVVPPKNTFYVPPAIVSAEFSSLGACEAAAARTIGELRRAAAPLIVHAGYTCNKKARSVESASTPTNGD